MKTDNSILFNRRGFLKTAALLGGAAALEIGDMPLAGAARSKGQGLTTLWYWSDDGLVDAGTLPSGDSSLMESGVRVTIENYSLPAGAEPLIRGFVAEFLIDTGEQSESVPYYAWAPSNPVKRSSFFMPVSPANGILFSVVTTASQFPAESYYLAVDNASPGPKLRTGLYAIASRYGGTGRVAPKTENGVVRLVNTYDEPPSFEHLLIDVAEAV
jgi:hypothetical protein